MKIKRSEIKKAVKATESWPKNSGYTTVQLDPETGTIWTEDHTGESWSEGGWLIANTSRHIGMETMMEKLRFTVEEVHGEKLEII